jgi:hypothetical protein
MSNNSGSESMSSHSSKLKVLMPLGPKVSRSFRLLECKIRLRDWYTVLQNICSSNHRMSTHNEFIICTLKYNSEILVDQFSVQQVKFSTY